jgi:C4-dicarboxylate transporter DctQ subunit
MNVLLKFHRALLRLEDAVLLFLVATIILLPVLQIFSRVFDWQGLLWANQAVRLGVLWLALTGAMIASRQQQHIRIDLLQHFQHTRWYDWTQRFTHLCTAIICAVIAWYCADLVIADYGYGDKAFVDLPLWVCEVIIPVAFAVIALRFFVAACIGKDTTANSARPRERT